MIFKKGDRVKVKTSYPKNILHGKVGIILEDGSNMPFVAFSENIGGHDCEGMCRRGYGWAVPAGQLFLIKKQMVNK